MLSPVGSHPSTGHGALIGSGHVDVVAAAGCEPGHVVVERPDLLVGGPPCAAFSKSGFWLAWKRDGVGPAAHTRC